MTPHVRRIATADFDWAAADGVAAALRAVVEAAERADQASPLDEAALLTLRHQGLAGSTLLLAGEPVAGFAWLREGTVDLVVHPEHRGHGLGRALVDATLEAADRPGVSAWSHGDHRAAAALASATGFERVRDLWVMRLPLSGPGALPALPDPPPPDVVVRVFEPGRDEEALLALNAEAFAQHPEQGGLTRADLDQRMSQPWFDPAGLFLAEDGREPGGELIGFHWTKVHPGAPPHGEVYVVGVSPHAQGSGLGRLLTLTGLHHLASLGLSEVVLYVESDNAAGRRVYERLGFTHADTDTHVQYHHA